MPWAQGMHRRAVRRLTVPAGVAGLAVVGDRQRHPGDRSWRAGVGAVEPVTRVRHLRQPGDCPGAARACWGCVRVVTTGSRRVVTTLPVGAAGCGRAPPSLQQGSMSAEARAVPPAWGRQRTSGGRPSWGRERRRGRPRTRISRPCGRRLAGDQAGWGTRRSGQGDAVTSIRRADSASGCGSGCCARRVQTATAVVTATLTTMRPSSAVLTSSVTVATVGLPTAARVLRWRRRSRGRG